MYSPERPNPESHFPISLIDYRQDVNDDIGQPNYEFIDNTLKQWQVFSNETLAYDLLFDTEKIQVKMAALKRKISEIVHFPISRPLLCALTLQHGPVQSVFNSAMDGKNRDNPGGFATFFDIGFGMNLVVSGINVAEQTIKGNSNQIVSDLMFNSNEHLSHLKQIEVQFLFNHLALLLKQDNSGISLVEFTAERLKTPEAPQRIPKFMIREFVIAGAETAVELYKTLYLLTEKL